MSEHSSLNSLSETNNKHHTQSLPAGYTPLPEEGDEGGLDLGQWLGALRRRIFVIAGVTTVVAATSVGGAINKVTTYQARFELLVNPVTVENKLTSSPLNEETQPTAITKETELRILQSPKLISPITTQIQAYYPDSGSPRLGISHLKNTNILEVRYQDEDPKKVEVVLDIVSKAYLAYSLEERQIDIRQGLQFVESQIPPLRQRVETLQEQLQQFQQRHNLIDPKTQGEQLSSQLSDIVQQQLNTQTELVKAQSLYNTLQSQLGLQPNEVVAAAALSEAPRYQKLLDDLQELETKIALETARYTKNSPNVENLRIQQQNLRPLVEQEAQRVLLNKVSGTIVQSRSLGSPNSVRLQQIQEFLSAASQMEALKAQKQALAEAETALRKQFQQFPALVRQNNNLERQLKISVDNLNQFWTKREALRIDAAQKQAPWQLLTPPTTPKPSVADSKLNLMLGTVLGLLLGIGVALLIDKLNNVFYTSEQIKDVTRLPLLGEIPFNKEPSKSELAALLNKEHNKLGLAGLLVSLSNKFRFGKRGKSYQQEEISDFWESLSSFYTNIRFLSFDTPGRSLAIMSPAAEEGKSTIALHLAQTAAAMGQRVLLVDADLRSPKIHLMLNLLNTDGLSNIIAENLDFHKVLHRINCASPKPIEDNLWQAEGNNIRQMNLEQELYVLTAGSIPPNPTSLLSSQKMRNLTVEFELAFDLVIYDTSPVLNFADSSLLGAYVDASILVVRLGKTNCSDLGKVLEKLKISSTAILGVVANGVKG